ncbi:MAG TPA: signal peptidase I [Pyrinomonadaceae bacterium]|nr:signal peptidase I [Pyrinomonadaceae bacterium]
MGLFRRKRAGAHVFGDVHFEDDRDIEVQRPRDESRAHFWAEARLLMRDLLFALMIMALVLVFVAQPVKVEGTSMLPRLHDGERIFVNKLIYYGLPELERGDIVVFWFPDDPTKSYIKRIIGLPGETVQMRAGRVFVNGRELAEPYLDPAHNAAPDDRPPVYVRPHYYFVMGDNRDNSSDSRAWGLVPAKYIYGKALFRYWPLSEASVIRHETEYPGVPRKRPVQEVEE